MADCFCPKCSAEILPSEYSGHQRQFHSSEERWHCRVCAFGSTNLPSFLAHCLLEGHYQFNPRSDATLTPPLEASSETKRSSTSTTLQGKENDPSFHSEYETEALAQEICPVPEKDTVAMQNSSTITCAKCKRQLATSFNNHLNIAKMHIRACCQIREFACSSCGMLATEKRYLRRHIESNCPSATLERVDIERCHKAEREAMAECFPAIEYRKRIVPENAQKLQCANCRSILHSSKKYYPKTLTIQHVRSCLKIKPFACSNCGYFDSQKVNVVSHIKSRKSGCGGATVELVDKEGCAESVAKGLRLCFPDYSFNAMEL